MAVPVKTGVLALALLAGGLPAAALAQAAPAAPAAAADAPVATAAGHAASPGNTTAAEIQTYESAPVDTTADGEDGEDGDGKRKIHGYVEVGVGNRGYREVDGAVTVPVGKDGQATVAISDAQGDGWRR